MEFLSALVTAITALIPDPVEHWLAGGGNTTIVLAVGAAALAYYVLRPAPEEDQ